jgi:hypothetical protein
MLALSDPSEREKRRRTHPGHRIADERCQLRFGVGQLLGANDLRRHLPDAPGGIRQAGDHGPRCLRRPNVQQSTGAPNPRPIFLVSQSEGLSLQEAGRVRAADPGQGRMAAIVVWNSPAEKAGAPARNLGLADQSNELENPRPRRTGEAPRLTDRDARPYSSERWTRVMSIQRSNLLAALRMVPTVSNPALAWSCNPDRLSVAIVATIVL